MRSTIPKRSLVSLFSILTALVLIIAPQSAFAVENSDEPLAQPQQVEEPRMPVGGVTMPDPKCVPAGLDIPSLSGDKRDLRKAGDIDEVFTRGASTAGYDTLSSDAQKALYKDIDEAAIAFMKSDADVSMDYGHYPVAEIDFYDLGITDIDDALPALYAYDLDHPAYYWMSAGYMYSYSSIYLCVDEEYAKASERQKVNSMIISGVRDYAELAENGTDTLDKISIIHDRLANDIDYAYESDGYTPVSEDWAHCVRGVFDPEHKEAVCEGYASAFSLLMNYMGIPNYYIVGYARTGGGGGGLHAWNAVSADGGQTYLYMDVTWDDYGDDGYAYQWFGMPASDFEETHLKSDTDMTYGMWQYDLTGPFRDSFEYTFYYAGKRYYDGSSDVAILTSDAIKKAARAGSYVSFMAPSTGRLQEVAYELGMDPWYYTTSYKGKTYYYLIAKAGNNHEHIWSRTVYNWAKDYSNVSAEHHCLAPNCKVGTETETVSTTKVVTKEATCTENGIITYTAEFANESFGVQTKEKTVKALGHAWNSGYTIDKNASCTEEGERSIHCSRCDTRKNIEVIPKLPHAYTDWVILKEANCTETGLKERSCTVCGLVETVEIPITHEYGEAIVIKDPTCTEPGLKEMECQLCHAIGYEEIPALGHTWDTEYTVDKAPTYAAEGSKSKHCLVCDAIDPDSVVSIPKLTVKATSIEKLTPAKRGFTVKWKKVSGITGYQIQYALNSKFTKGKKTVSIKKAGTASKKIKKLKGKKKYYVRVRTYKTYKGKKYYSKWSKKKAVKTKK